MLTITIPKVEFFDEKLQEFIDKDEIVIELEHSLVSLSKWESKWEKPFLGPKEKTIEETLDYVRAMTLTPNVPLDAYQRLSNENFEQINKYIEAKMSATWFTELPGAGKAPARKEIITSEIIYYWMVSLKINWEAQHWHLNRLFTLIKVCNQKNQPEKKMSRSDLIAQRNMLNAQRKSQMNSSG